MWPFTKKQAVKLDPEVWSGDKAYKSLNTDKIFPGSPVAKEMGCTCSGKRAGYRDGIGYEIANDCHMHINLPELAE